MHSNWTSTAAALPSPGASVEFLLDERECPMRGTYVLGRFESRWTHYAPTSVRQWRSMADAAWSMRPPVADVRQPGTRPSRRGLRPLRPASVPLHA